MNNKIVMFAFAFVFSVFLIGNVSALTSISNCTQLQDMNLDLTEDYQLTTNIDCSDTATWNSGEGFIPIGNDSVNFEGTFDGQEYNITNLWINRTANNQGLFGYSTGLIENVGIINVSITMGEGSDKIGGLAGYSAGTINNSYSTGKIEGYNYYSSGGLVGYLEGNVTNSYSTANVTGYVTVGGLVGWNEGIIDYSFATGFVNSTNQNAGGLVGENYNTITNSYATGEVYSYFDLAGGLVSYSDGVIDNCSATGNVYSDTGSYIGGLVGEQTNQLLSNSFATGDVSGQGNVGGFAGSLYGGNITNSYATGNVNGDYNVGGLIGQAYGSLNYIDSSYSTGNVNGNLLGNGDEIGGLIGYTVVSSAESIFILTNSYALGNVTGDVDVGGLIGFSDNLGSGYLEINECYSEGIVNGTGYVGGLIGTTYTSSTSILINNCHSIGNVYSTGTYTGGLVGYSQGEYNVVANSYSESNVTGTENVGGLIGQLDANGNVTGCYAVGNVYGSASELGGLIGENYGNVINSFAMGNVYGGVSSASAGGLIGYSEGFISTCYATGDVTTTSNNMGGLVGDMNGILENSYATGDISGEGSVGGFVGMSENNANITNCFAVGSATNTAGNTGGLIGRNEGNITNCYSSGEVDGIGENDGGLVGLDTSGDWGNSITGSYWNLQMSEQNSSAGGTGLTTAQMKNQSSFVDWDFGSVWEITAGYFPNLQFNEFLYPSAFSEQTVYVTADYTYQAIDSNLNDVVTGSVTGFKSATDFFPTFIVLGSLIVLVLITVIIINAIRSSGITQEQGGA